MFKNKHSELRSGWVLAMSLILVLLLQVIIGFVLSLTVVLMGYAEESILLIAESPLLHAVICLVSTGFLFLLFWLVYKRPLTQMGFYKDGWAKQMLFGGVFGIIAVSVIVALLLSLGMARVDSVDFGNFARWPLWEGLILFVCVGFFEEILCRGVMMTALKTTRKSWLIVILPTLIFAIMHAANSNLTALSLINLALAGLLFAFLFIKTGRLWAPIGFHITWNFFMGNVLGIAVSGENFSAVSIAVVELTGPDWLTGGAFGIEGGLVCTLILALAMVFVHFYVKQPENFWRIDSDMPLTRGSPLAGATHVGDIQ